MLPQSGFEQKCNLESSKATYSAVIADFVPAANATDFITLVGSASKTLTLTNVRISGSATASTYQGIYLYKRTTLDTTGTSTPTAITIHDSQDTAAKGVVNQYTVNPGALGTGTLLRSDHVGLPAAAAGTTALVWDFGDRAAKAPKLQAATESFCLNFAAAAVPAGTNLHITLEWTEE
jgi:hypothetical protein